MRILVTSASGANGNGYGAILGFGPEGECTGPFSADPRIVAFDFRTGSFVGTVAHIARLNGQALVLVPQPEDP